MAAWKLPNFFDFFSIPPQSIHTGTYCDILARNFGLKSIVWGVLGYGGRFSPPPVAPELPRRQWPIGLTYNP